MYLEQTIAKYPEHFEEFDTEEPLLMWYSDALKIAREIDLLENVESITDRDSLNKLFVEEVDEEFYKRFMYTKEKYSLRAEDFINMIYELNGNTYGQLATSGKILGV